MLILQIVISIAQEINILYKILNLSIYLFNIKYNIIHTINFVCGKLNK